MTIASPLSGDTSLVTFTIKVGGKAIDSTVEVMSVDTWAAVNKVPKAQIVILDGDPAKGDFEISSLATFLPGKKVEISAGYDGKEAPIFLGVICKQGIEIGPSRSPRLVVDLIDETARMTLERKNAVFEKVKDSDLISRLIGSHGLGREVSATRAVHPQVVQYYATDWDLMVTRAEMNGLVVIVESGKVSVKAPDTRQTPVLSVKYGDSILGLEAEMDAATQLAHTAIKSHAWDTATQKLVEAEPEAVEIKEQGNVSSAELAKVFNVKKHTRQTGGLVERSALQAWSSAELLKSKLAKIRGFVRFQGSSKIRTGKTLELGGLGARFNGTAYVSGVHHIISDGQWRTTAELGLSPRWFAAEASQIAAPAASGQLPPIRGLQTGIVKTVAKDPDGEHRVLITLPLLQEPGKGVWARLGTFYGSGKVGAFFYPEVNDEVIVGFMNEDPRYPVILGSVYSKKLAPPLSPDEQNNKKALVTRGNLSISFDDKDKIIEIRTGKHSIKLDDKSGALSIKDGNRNTISLSRGGISLESGGNIKLKAQGNISIQSSTGNLNLSASGTASMEGMQVAHKATTKFSASASAVAEVKASGILTLRGLVVKIN